MSTKAELNKMSVKDLRSKLTELGAEASEVEAIEDKKVLVSMVVELEKSAKDAEKASAKASSVVIIKGTRVIRTYSEEVQGEDFEEMAAGFILKNPGMEIVSPESIEKVVVHFRELSPKDGLWHEKEEAFTDIEAALKKMRASADSQCVIVRRKA